MAPKRKPDGEAIYGWYIKDGVRVPVTVKEHKKQIAKTKKAIFNDCFNPAKAGMLQLSSKALKSDADLLDSYVIAFVNEFTGSKKARAASDAIEIKKIIKMMRERLDEIDEVFKYVNEGTR